MAKPPPKGPRPDNPLLARLEHKAKQSPAYHASAGLEKGLAKRTGGYRTAGSGNKNEKGDVRVKGIARIEHKGTQHDSFRVTKTILSKIEKAARACDEVPILVVDFLDKAGKTTGQEIACIPMQDLLDLIDDAKASPQSDSKNSEPKKPPRRTRLHRP